MTNPKQSDFIHHYILAVWTYTAKTFLVVCMCVTEVGQVGGMFFFCLFLAFFIYENLFNIWKRLCYFTARTEWLMDWVVLDELWRCLLEKKWSVGVTALAEKDSASPSTDLCDCKKNKNPRLQSIKNSWFRFFPPRWIIQSALLYVIIFFFKECYPNCKLTTCILKDFMSSWATDEGKKWCPYKQEG